ncbi:MAG: hypothetical protein K2Q18_09380 [Bdellovibrionales bacterium]|nr:hypothetical protein [Bdellovibrionales bacterium]
MPQKSSNSVKLYGFGVLKNGVKFDFPFKESVYSMKPITEGIYFALGDSVDSTNLEFEKMGFPKVVHTTWDKSLKDGKVISVETNIALNFLKHDLGQALLKSAWGIYLQADEVLHEDDYAILKKDLEHCEANGFDAISLRYLHFWQTHHHIAVTKNWYPHEIRLIKLDSPIESWGDGQSFKNHQKIFYSEARIFHYGHVREQKAYAEKMRFQSSFHHADHLVEEKLKKDAENSKKHKTNYFFGTHPLIMKERILRMNDIWELPQVDEIAIVGSAEKYSPEIIRSINAKKVSWFKKLSEVPKNLREKMIITEPTVIDYFFKRATPGLKMKSKHAIPWNDNFKLIMQLSSRKVGFRHD